MFAPEPLGRVDILCVFGRIAALGPDLAQPPPPFACEVVDARGRYVLPGLVDGHVHILGGGGEGGPATRAPEVTATALLSAGVTTVVGLLGFDGVMRSLASLLAKARALAAEGVAAWIYTGSYQIPPATITGDVERDIALVGEVVGVGEVAIADARASQADPADVVRLAARARIGGLLAGKPGLLHLHVGDAPSGLRRLRAAVAASDLPAAQFYPTHVNRRRPLLHEAAAFAREGAPLDVTAACRPELGEPEAVPPEEALPLLLREGVDPARLTLSSDGNGSLPVFDAAGRVVEVGVGSLRVLWESLQKAVRAGLPLATALAFATRNPARILGLPRKGAIEPGADADLLVVSPELEIERVVVAGRIWDPAAPQAWEERPEARPAIRSARAPFGQTAW
ncbi:MAG: beta-aspartyl-peptidase [Clostridia bacterium]|nr:beta-aspartyl-peptidase [Clostridia bacterium]